jgi:AcrR family transcriptional regulator
MREKILGAAIQMFGENGFKSSTVKGLAQRLGIAQGSLYTYFPSKEQLFRSAVEEGWERFLDEIRRIVKAPKMLRERFENILDYCFETLKDALPLLRGMLYEARQRRLLQENLQRLCRLLEGMIWEAQKQGMFRIQGDGLSGQIKIIVFGILTAVALARDEDLESEIASVKSAIYRILNQRLRPEVEG